MMRIQIVVLLLVLVGCGSPIDDKGSSKGPGSQLSANNTTSNNTTSNGTTNPASCGDGVLDAGELCDPGKASGPGACPTSCEAPACASASLVGSAAQCTAQCIVEPAACSNGDGCCAAGCDAVNDNDCSNQCGDGLVEGPETCDGNCPAQCGDDNLCTTDVLVGSASECDARCSFEAITACSSGDGCCPAGCTADRDDDCEPTVSCGNGVLDAGELCDGNCPSTCTDSIACTTDRLTGSPATCDAQCTHTVIAACVSGDGCCPTGCTSQTDNDCVCIPRTCAQAGAECGVIDTGCNSTISCTNTCSTIETCGAQNQCVSENFIGDDCLDYPECGSSEDAVCILPPMWPGGYCSILCNGASGNTLCPSGSHCADFDGVNSLCMLNCTSTTQCDAGYVCRQFDGTGGMECVPPVPPAGSGSIGDACGADADCSGTLICEQTYSSSNGTITFPGGVCTEACVPLLGSCPVGNVCTLETLCMAGCATNADCRVGYSCTGFGLPLASTYCWPT